MTAVTSISDSNAKFVASGGAGVSASACAPEKEVVSWTKQAWFDQAKTRKCSLQQWFEAQAKMDYCSVEHWQLNEYAKGDELRKIEEAVTKFFTKQSTNLAKDRFLTRQMTQLHKLRDEVLFLYVNVVKEVEGIVNHTVSYNQLSKYRQQNCVRFVDSLKGEESRAKRGQHVYSVAEIQQDIQATQDYINGQGLMPKRLQEYVAPKGAENLHLYAVKTESIIEFTQKYNAVKTVIESHRENII